MHYLFGSNCVGALIIFYSVQKRLFIILRVLYKKKVSKTQGIFSETLTLKSLVSTVSS